MSVCDCRPKKTMIVVHAYAGERGGAVLRSGQCTGPFSGRPAFDKHNSGDQRPTNPKRTASTPHRKKDHPAVGKLCFLQFSGAFVGTGMVHEITPLKIGCKTDPFLGLFSKTRCQRGCYFLTFSTEKFSNVVRFHGRKETPVFLV